MTSPSRARAHDRLAELVVVLSGARHHEARDAITEAIDRNGDAGDNLINVADAIMALRMPMDDEEVNGHPEAAAS